MTQPLHPAARGLVTLLARRAFDKAMQRAAAEAQFSAPAAADIESPPKEEEATAP